MFRIDSRKRPDLAFRCNAGRGRCSGAYWFALFVAVTSAINPIVMKLQTQSVVSPSGVGAGKGTSAEWRTLMGYAPARVFADSLLGPVLSLAEGLVAPTALPLPERPPPNDRGRVAAFGAIVGAGAAALFAVYLCTHAPDCMTAVGGVPLMGVGAGVGAVAALVATPVRKKVGRASPARPRGGEG